MSNATSGHISLLKWPGLTSVEQVGDDSTKFKHLTFPPKALLSGVDAFYSEKSDFCIEKVNFT